MVPEVLFAWSRDIGYLRECQDALFELASGIFPVNETDTWIASVLLYFLTVAWRKGKTAGMEIAGLEFHSSSSSDSKNSIQQKWRMSLELLVMVSLIYGYRKRQQQHSQTVERLTGEERRRVFAQQRRAMRQSTDTPTHYSNTAAAAVPNSMIRYLLETLQSITASVVSLNENSIPPHIPESQLRVPYSSTLLRLCLGYFCLTGGQLPFPLNKLSIFQYTVSESARLNYKPNSFKTIGFLILLEALGQGLDTFTKALAKYLAKRSNAKKENLLTSSGILGPPLTPEQIKKLALCAICRTPRVRPACSVHCGHIFCSSCLLEWTRRHQVCPYCRQPCMPQEVIPLCSYHKNRDTKNGNQQELTSSSPVSLSRS